MNDERQSSLLVEYLAMLRTDVSAAPPPELDPDLARFAQKLARAVPAPPNEAVRERVWQRALHNAATRGWRTAI